MKHIQRKQFHKSESNSNMIFPNTNTAHNFVLRLHFWWSSGVHTGVHTSVHTGERAGTHRHTLSWAAAASWNILYF